MVGMCSAVGAIVAVDRIPYGKERGQRPQHQVRGMEVRRMDKASKPTGVTFVGVGFHRTFGDREVTFVGQLVHGELAATEDFAGIAVAEERVSLLVEEVFKVEKGLFDKPENVRFTIKFGSPFQLAAMTASVESRHNDESREARLRSSQLSLDGVLCYGY